MALTQPNDGSRPSRLELDRYATGELDAEARAAVEARLDDRARAHLAAVEAARTATPRPDWAAIRARAEAMAVAEAAPRPAANDGRAFRWLRPLIAVAVAAVALILVVPRDPDPGVGPGYVGVKGGEALAVYQLTGQVLTPIPPGTSVGEDDVVGFKVTQRGHRGVVLLSVDGTGTITVFQPTSGDAPVPLPDDGEVPLPGTVILDGAPGPEVFVAVFDMPASEARAELARRFQSGGHEAVLAWAEQTGGVAAVEVPRR